MREWCLFRASFATSELLAISEDVSSHSGPTTRCGIAALGDGAEWSRMGFIPQDQTVHRVSTTAVSNWLYLIHHRYFAINLECLRPKLFCAILDTRRANRWHHSLRLVAHQGQPSLVYIATGYTSFESKTLSMLLVRLLLNVLPNPFYPPRP
jgi:hypothetical protein